MPSNKSGASRARTLYFKNHTEQDLAEDLDEIKEMLTDMMLPSAVLPPDKKFGELPMVNTVCRKFLKEALASKRYKRELTISCMLCALKYIQPYQWLSTTFSDIMDAIEEESDNE